MTRILAICSFFVLAACSPQDSDPNPSNPSNPAKVPAGPYTLDKAHSTLIFRVNHLGFSNYTARFKRFDARLQFDPENLAASKITVTIDARSLDLDSPPAGFNETLQNEQWLSTAQFPEMTYRSTQIEVTGPNRMRIHGELDLRGMTRTVILEATFNGGYAGHALEPQARVGFSAHGSLQRSKFGMAIGVPPPGSTMGVSDDVEIIIESEFSGPPWAGAAAGS